MNDREAFARLQRDGWERVAGKYESSWASLTRQFVKPLVEAAGVGAGARVLDVACGPGYVAEAVHAVGAHATGVDFSPEMVRIATARVPGVEFRRGDAEALDFDTASFDRVLTNFGILHFAWPERALAEARRVLRSGGRLGFTVWAPPEVNPGTRIVDEAMREHGEITVDLPEGPPRSLAVDETTCREFLAAAGFAPLSIRIATVTADWTIPTLGFLFEAERDAGVRTAAVLARQSPERLAAIRAAIEERVARFAAPGGYVIPMAARVVTADPAPDGEARKRER